MTFPTIRAVRRLDLKAKKVLENEKRGSGKQERNIKGSNYQPPPTTILCTIFWFNAHTKLSSSLPTSQVKPLAGTRAVTQVDLSWVGCRRRRSRRRRRRGCTSPVSCFVPRPLRTAPSLPPSQRLEAAPQSSSGHPTQRPARPVAGLQWSQHPWLKSFCWRAFKNPLFNPTVPESDLPSKVPRNSGPAVGETVGKFSV